MKLMKICFTLLVFVVLLSGVTQSRDSQDEKRVRRNERRSERRFKRMERRLKNHHRRVVAVAAADDDDVSVPEVVELTPVTPSTPPLRRRPRRPEAAARRAARARHHQAVHDFLMHSEGNENQQNKVDLSTNMDLDVTQGVTTTASRTMDNDDDVFVADDNMTWSGDHDLVRPALNDTLRYAGVNRTLNETSRDDRRHYNVTTTPMTPRPPRSTPDPHRLAMWRNQKRYFIQHSCSFCFPHYRYNHRLVC